ncbi:hypothetical protein [Mesomycoplasma neurolyticum]|uniref:Uncharacterized protein n=1 Tax=Mesomycoplasma neurolyticum TaxID=2120 RepID=A0A449A527_9BACT|nr:hypothetical protein [Mesomycoplasma neurolyticum]VEU59336.1 Uncharacterised protein [Mesomycoplasma neurolyticum]
MKKEKVNKNINYIKNTIEKNKNISIYSLDNDKNAQFIKQIALNYLTNYDEYHFMQWIVEIQDTSTKLINLLEDYHETRNNVELSLDKLKYFQEIDVHIKDLNYFNDRIRNIFNEPIKNIDVLNDEEFLEHLAKNLKK